MRQDGFSLTELVVTIAIFGTLLAIATLQFSAYTSKAQVQALAQAIYGDVARVRTQGMFTRRPRTVKFSATGYSIYSSNVVTVSPVESKTVTHQITFTGDGKFDFDERGIGSTGSVCVEPGANEASFDSIVISETRTRMGKSNGTCNSDSITNK